MYIYWDIQLPKCAIPALRRRPRHKNIRISRLRDCGFPNSQLECPKGREGKSQVQLKVGLPSQNMFQVV